MMLLERKIAAGHVTFGADTDGVHSVSLTQYGPVGVPGGYFSVSIQVTTEEARELSALFAEGAAASEVRKAPEPTPQDDAKGAQAHACCIPSLPLAP